MQYIYTRVSTEKQATENQLHSLRQLYPEALIFEEIISGTKSFKPVLEGLLALLRPGDTLVLGSLDRLGRRAGKAIQLIDMLYERGIKVHSVREGLDYSTSSGKLIGQITLAVSENERNMISERTKLALAARKAAGIRLGRPSKYNQLDIALIKEHRSNGLTMTEISKLTNISPATICRALKTA